MVEEAKKSDTLRIAVAQFNPVVGDIKGNAARAQQAYQKAKQDKINLLLFTELFICGYPVEDMVLDRDFLQQCKEALIILAEATKNQQTAMLIGAPVKRDGKVYNAVLLLRNGKIEQECYKCALPNYAEFDEKRVFSAGEEPALIELPQGRFGVLVCEDIWSKDLQPILVRQGAEFIFVLNASPYCHQKIPQRQAVVAGCAEALRIPIFYSNQIGGQDELVFDGGSFAVDANGKIVVQLKQFEEQFSISQWVKQEGSWQCVAGETEPLYESLAADYSACVLGLRDYARKNNFKKLLLGLSGGIDSALCAAIAVDAYGADAVQAYFLPYLYTSPISERDAKLCAQKLGICLEVLPIGSAVEAFKNILQPLMVLQAGELANQNLQSRVRGTLLMGLSNKNGGLLLSTGNKSEIAMGYATLYGDMNGGFNPLKDIFKTQIYALANWRNQNYLSFFNGPEGNIIPDNMLVKAPSAELAPNQKDEDSLPPYAVLDAILKAWLEEGQSVEQLVAAGYKKDLVKKILQICFNMEYKRRQAPPGVKITKRSFGRDRRYPITNKFQEVF